MHCGLTARMLSREPLGDSMSPTRLITLVWIARLHQRPVSGNPPSSLLRNDMLEVNSGHQADIGSINARNVAF